MPTLVCNMFTIVHQSQSKYILGDYSQNTVPSSCVEISAKCSFRGRGAAKFWATWQETEIAYSVPIIALNSQSRRIHTTVIFIFVVIFLAVPLFSQRRRPMPEYNSEQQCHNQTTRWKLDESVFTAASEEHPTRRTFSSFVACSKTMGIGRDRDV